MSAREDNLWPVEAMQEGWFRRSRSGSTNRGARHHSVTPQQNATAEGQDNVCILALRVLVMWIWTLEGVTENLGLNNVQRGFKIALDTQQVLLKVS